MREIKFRGKRIDNGEWVDGFFSRINGEPIILSPMDSYKYYRKFFVDVPFKQVIPETVGQYTGLKDKNGKEIYEGDILKSDSGYRLIVRFGNHGYSAYTDCVELGFYCECISEQAKRQQIREDFIFWVREEQSEIIGNVHENPELLENS